MNTKTLTQEDLIVKTCRQECRENGIRKTTIKWASQVITNWNLMLEDGDINAHQPSELKAIIRENLTIRDSIIIASMTPSISVDELTTLAADAHTASKKRELNNLIDDAYSTGAYDHERAAKAISLLDPTRRRQ